MPRGKLATRAHVATHLTRAAGDAAGTVRDGVDSLSRQLPTAIETVEAGARATTALLRVMPDENLRLLAAVSIGLGAGLFLAGAPRLVTLAALTPALLVATVAITRPVTRIR